MGQYGKIAIVDVSADKSFSRNVAKILEIRPHDVKVETFPDSDKKLIVEPSVRGNDVFIFSHYVEPVRENFSLLTDAAYACQQGGKARRLTAVMPYCYGSRGERATRSREAVPIIKVIRELHAAGIENVITMGLHAEAVTTMFELVGINVEHLPFEDLAANYIIRTARENGYRRVAIASPDFGGSKRLELLEKILYNQNKGLLGELVLGRKQRNGTASTEHKGFVGDVKGQVVFVYDDIGDTLGTAEGLVKAAKAGGAEGAYVIFIHSVSGTPEDPEKESYKPRLERLCKDEFVRQIVFGNTIPLKSDVAEHEKVRTIPVEPFFAEAIRRSSGDNSMSELREYGNIMAVYDGCRIKLNGKNLKVGRKMDANTSHRTQTSPLLTVPR